MFKKKVSNFYQHFDLLPNIIFFVIVYAFSTVLILKATRITLLGSKIPEHPVKCTEEDLWKNTLQSLRLNKV